MFFKQRIAEKVIIPFHLLIIYLIPSSLSITLSILFSRERERRLRAYPKSPALQKLLPFKVHELLKIFGETINDYIKTLPVNEQQQYYEAIAKEL